MPPEFSYTLSHQDGAARAGTLTTAHGKIDTPIFMPVGTCASVKALTQYQLEDSGAPIILGNTYHLMLRPGADRVAALGGLRRFMDWPGAILTDSGGFQVMSLSGISKISEEGVLFSSHIDGSKHMLSPETSMDIQHKLDSTITMIFDECLRYPATEEETRASTELSLRWAKRSKEAYKQRTGYGLFGIVQGGMVPDLRKVSAEGLQHIGFDGYAVGGLAVGEGQENMFSMLDITCPLLPQDRPRYLMGVGKPDDILGAIARGIDMFDCVLPTRSGRNGQLFTSRGPVNIRNAKYASQDAPADPECACPTCARHSAAYLHHLVKAGEMAGAVYLTLHNIHFYLNLTRSARAAIQEKRFAAFHRDFLETYRGG